MYLLQPTTGERVHGSKKHSTSRLKAQHKCMFQKKLEHKTRKPFKTPYVTPKCMTEQNVIDQHWYGACRPESKFHLGTYQIKAAFFLLCYKHI